jgi:hypothetical protein
MREHPFVASPLSAFTTSVFPADTDVDFARRLRNEAETWPSELGFGGRIGWKRFHTGRDGWVEVSYPDVR